MFHLWTYDTVYNGLHDHSISFKIKYNIDLLLTNLKHVNFNFFVKISKKNSFQNVFQEKLICHIYSTQYFSFIFLQILYYTTEITLEPK